MNKYRYKYIDKKTNIVKIGTFNLSIKRDGNFITDYAFSGFDFTKYPDPDYLEEIIIGEITEGYNDNFEVKLDECEDGDFWSFNSLEATTIARLTINLIN